MLDLKLEENSLGGHRGSLFHHPPSPGRSR
jgi:hypothetical protein